MALISQLPRDQAEAVVLRVVVGLDAKSAAQVLGKRSGAVRTAAHRGLRKLAELLEERALGPSGDAVDGAGGAVADGPAGDPGGPEPPAPGRAVAWRRAGHAAWRAV